MATMVRSHFCPHSSPYSGWIAIAFIKERAAAGLRSHLCPCSGPCIVGGLLHCKNVWITSTCFWLPELHRTIDDLQLRCPNWVKVTQSFLQCAILGLSVCTCILFLIACYLPMRSRT